MTEQRSLCDGNPGWVPKPSRALAPTGKARLRLRVGIAVVLMALVLPAACEQTLRTGKVGNTTNAPNPDGTCPTGLTVCGKGAFARCLDLQNDWKHCGTCDNTCVLGIACAASTCQQVACTGPVTVSTQAIPGGTTPGQASFLSIAILADINGDGRPDLVSWGYDDGANLENGFRVALGEAGGGFAPATTYQTPGYPNFIVTGDSNGDGFQDLYATWVGLYSTGVELWLGHADGKLTLATETDIPECIEATVADLNGDGRLDLVCDIGDASGLTVFLADANGDFHVGTSNPGCIGTGTVVWDWNGEGFPDLVNLFPTLSVCLNKGNGTFDDEMDCGVATSKSPMTTVIGDFNRDGHPDLATAMDGNVDVLLGMGGCQFQPMMEYPLTDVVTALASGDLNGDGLLDLVATTKDGTVSLLLGGPDGAFQVVPLSVVGPPCGNGGSLLVGNVTGDGKADIVFVPNAYTSYSAGDGGGALVRGGCGATTVLENTCP